VVNTVIFVYLVNIKLPKLDTQQHNMNKTEFEKAMNESARSRALLLIEDVARNRYNEMSILTTQQKQQVRESLQKPRERKILNDLYKIDDQVANGLKDLQGVKFEVLRYYSYMQGYILILDTLLEAKKLSNNIIKEIIDVQERKKIADKAISNVSFPLAQVESTQKGDIIFNIDFEETNNSFWYAISGIKKNVVISATRFISWRKAMKDYMKENKFNVQIYNQVIESMEESIYRPIVPWEEYQSKEVHTMMDKTYQKLEKDVNKYAIVPDIKKLEVNIGMYNNFKQAYLYGEV
jgi:hypothetical protein